MAKHVEIYAGCSSVRLASKVVEAYGKKFDDPFLELRRTNDNNFKLHTAGANVFFIQSSFLPIDRMVNALEFIQSAQRYAHKINVVIPYFGFSQQTRYDEANDLVSFLTTTGADRILSMDVYADMCQGISEIPIDQMYVAPLFARAIKKMELDNLLIVAPGEWAHKRAKILRKEGIDAQVVSCEIEKKSNKITGITFEDHCHFRGKNIILLKEVLHTGETTVALADYLKTKRVANVYAMAAHAMIESDTIERIEKSCIEKLIVTDSMPLVTRKSPKIRLISVAETIADKIHEIASVSKN